MRTLLSACVAANLLAASALSPAALADSCARPYEKQAFDVSGLKSELMVIAIACQAQDKYNSFVMRYRRQLVIGDRALNGYFARTAGRRAQQQHDDYITNLANTESEDGVRQGTLFCQQHLRMFDEVMALKDSKDLPAYAASKALPQPITLSECTRPKKKLRTAEEK